MIIVAIERMAGVDRNQRWPVKLIVGAVILQILFGNPMEVRPLMVSKANTVAQITMVTVALAGLGFGFDIAVIFNVLIGVAALLTVASGAAYLVTWLRFVGTNDGSGDGTHQQG